MRLFVAAELDKPVKDALRAAQRRLRQFDGMVRWVGEEQMHLTLKFLGEVADGRLPEIEQAVASAAAASDPFELHVQGAGCFPPHGKARVVWVGLDDSAGQTVACQRRVEDELQGAGFPAERRPFTPHLTLGRVRDDHSNGELRRCVEGLAAPELCQPVNSIVLMQSELTPQGARYTRLGVCELGRGEDLGD